MEASLSSKVTVEYHDPSGVFPLISQDLAARLPLRNLNWKSPTRPLRSIGALHVEFVPDAATAAKNGVTQLQRLDSTGPNTDGSSAGSGKERRHQIPGLLQTPYLKIYLLRCDDKDAYKVSKRQLLRDWIKQNTPPIQTTPQASKVENHDACEWLILHVVIPDTVAASEPRWTAASKKDPDELVERPQSTAKWPGKSTRTVLDKIRADFNVSSKSAPDRVAQIRLQKKDVPANVLPHSPVPSMYTESPQEQDNAWQDLVSKFKTLILTSFDMRVSQYEDDIREKDAQRALPGWNFCTFFTLKEGLARGFESVGLVEDALAIYDELSAGLDTAVRDSVSGTDAANGTFLGDMQPHRDALQQIVQSSTAGNDNADQKLQAIFTDPLDLTKKDYRGEIVKSTICLFDFHLYIFARQRTLLIRLSAALGPAQQKRPQSSQSVAKDDNLASLAQACKRAAAFAASNSRVLRHGLRNEYDHTLYSPNVEIHVDSLCRSQPESQSSSLQIDSLVENVASSWTYAVIDQILAETVSDRLPSSQTSSDGLSTPQRPGSGSHNRGDGNAFSFPQGANTHANRSSSLQKSGSSSSSSLTPASLEKDRFNKMPSAMPSSMTLGQVGAGVAGLAASRAELFTMQRNIIETMARKKGWKTGWAALVSTTPVTEVNLNDKDDEDDATAPDAGSEEMSDANSKTLLSAALSTVLTTEQDFRAAYEQLTNLALSHFVIANRTNSSNIMTSDLAVLKYQIGDYAQAATLFQKSSPVYLQGNWTYVHAEMLRAYAKCLKELHRKDEYMRVMLSLLSKVIARQRAQKLPKMRFATRDPSSAWHDDEAIDINGILADLSVYSKDLPYNFTSPMMDFFDDIHISPEVTHYEDKDGFCLDVQFRHLLEDEFTLEKVRLRLVSTQEPVQEIWLGSDTEVELKRGLMKLKLHSNITTYGGHLVDKLVLDSDKLRFIHDFQPKPQATPLGITNATKAEQDAASTGPAVLIFPHGDAFEVRASLTRQIYVDKLRDVVIDINTGRNAVESLDLRLRAASAGLRLHTAEATTLGEGIELDTSQGGLLHTEAIDANQQVRIALPYSLEHSRSDVTIKIEAQYKTSAGTFVFVSTCVIIIELPLDVDVHDIFKAKSLFSRFSIRTTNSVPLQVTKVTLADSAAYAVKALPCPPSMTVFDKQPANLTYKITKKTVDEVLTLDKKEAALAMTVHYLCVDEIVLDRITTSLRAALENSPYQHLRRLLLPLLRDGVQSHALALQLERAVLLRELRLPSYESVGWDHSIVDLPAASQDGLAAWLRDWHRQNKHMAFDPTTPGAHQSSAHREITITVDVPTIDVVHTATLSTRDPASSDSAPSVRGPKTPVTSVMGNPLIADLRITHTRRWATASPLVSSRTSSASRFNEQDQQDDEPSNFVYSLRDPTETWLIGGQRRAHFSFDGISSLPSTPKDEIKEQEGGEEREEKHFSIILIPLKPGTHLLPSIDIVPMLPPPATSSTNLLSPPLISSSSPSLVTTPTSSSFLSSSSARPLSAPDSSHRSRSTTKPRKGSAAAALWAEKRTSSNLAPPTTPIPASGATTAAHPTPTCETDYTSAGTVVRVTRDVRTTSMTVGATNNGTSAGAMFSSGGADGGDGFLGVGGGDGRGGGSKGGPGDRRSADVRFSTDTRISALMS
ncbi:hypothetical protein AAFC00_005176 [Neodothiora populina]|uniref:TMEM1 family protein n=1 Tax=Neodothiora populina TaxID=2781224 RepID=A0ABR3PK15_9PEZI